MTMHRNDNTIFVATFQSFDGLAGQRYRYFLYVVSLFDVIPFYLFFINEYFRQDIFLRRIYCILTSKFQQIKHEQRFNDRNPSPPSFII